MLPVSSKLLLHRFCHFARQTPYLEFHTSTCALKGGSRKKRGSSKARADVEPARPTSRKRLAKTLKPDGESGTYEVAPKPAKSRSGKARREDEIREETVHASKATETPQKAPEEPPPSPQTTFSREDAPHVGRTSWRSPRAFPAARPAAFDRRTSPFYSTRTDGILSRRKDNFPSNNTRFRGEMKPEASVTRRSFRERMFNEQQTSQIQPVHDSGDRSGRGPRPSTGYLPAEFETPPTEPLKTLPARFTSPPLLSGLLQSVHDVLGRDARPSPIQSLSLKYLFTAPPHIFLDEKSSQSPSSPAWGQYLLASETGSGKSFAYLLPMLQYLKLTEYSPTPLPSPLPPPNKSLSHNPRGLILAPTHELSRQLSSFAKSLLHNVRLRVLCTSRANNSSSSHGKSSTASQMKRELDDTGFGMTDGTQVLRKNQPVDVLVGTPSKVMEMVRGWGWNREEKIEDQWDDARKDRARNWVPGPPEVGLSKVEWVVIDEADILFDEDFQESTRRLLADISQARGYTPSFSDLQNSSASSNPAIPPQPLEYPFHFILTSATIPSSLASYLSTYHPKLTRLASPHLHRLPPTLKTEHHSWTSGNKNSDIEKRIKYVWAEDARSKVAKSKVLIFCNKSSKVEDLGLYLKERGIPNVALTSTAEARFRGSNRHLAGFLKGSEEMSSNRQGQSVNSSASAVLQSDPHVMITTSLLSRGLDFSPQIKHVFIVDEPRNMIDFLHRAGRSGRAGNEGKVVVFGKMKGRGSENAREVKRKIGALTL